MDPLHAILETKRKGLYTIEAEAAVTAAVDEMCERHVGALLVVRDDAPVGIISERDLMRRVILQRKDPAATTVAEVMTKNVVCIASDASVEEAMRVMTERRCRHLPVVLAGKIVGMLSIGDLVRWASQHQEYEIRMLQEYFVGKYPG